MKDDELEALARYYQAADDHKIDLLRRLDFEVPNDVSSFEYLQAMYAVATEDMGLSDDQFNTMDHRLFVARLERHVRDDEFQRRVLAELQRQKGSDGSMGPDRPSTEATQSRQEWMDSRHPGWSCVDWQGHTGISYKTIQRYREGVTTNKTRSTRLTLAQKEDVEFSTVPE